MNPTLENFLKPAQFLSEALPDSFGVMLFDLESKGIPCVFERSVTGAARDAARRCIKTALSSKTVVENGMLLKRSEASSKDKLRKLSVLFIKDEKGVPLGALALIIELNGILFASTLLNGMISLSTEELDEIAPMEEPKPASSRGLDSIDSFVEAETDDPSRLTPDEKMELILDLYDTGVFSVKGSVMRAAEKLHLSEQSVYRYIAKIKRMRGE